MFGFQSLSELLTSILADQNIPVDIKTDVILKTFNLPIEVIGAKRDVEGLKWVLSSRNDMWELSSELLNLIWKFDVRNSDWKL